MCVLLGIVTSIECRVNLGFAEKMALAGLEVDIVHIWSLPSLISRAILAPPSPAADQQMWIYIFLVLILTHSQYSTHWTIYFVTSLWTWEELDYIFFRYSLTSQTCCSVTVCPDCPCFTGIDGFSQSPLSKLVTPFQVVQDSLFCWGCFLILSEEPQGGGGAKISTNGKLIRRRRTGASPPYFLSLHHWLLTPIRFSQQHHYGHRSFRRTVQWHKSKDIYVWTVGSKTLHRLFTASPNSFVSDGNPNQG